MDDSGISSRRAVLKSVIGRRRGAKMGPGAPFSHEWEKGIALSIISTRTRDAL